jgi:hypothetical protein
MSSLAGAAMATLLCSTAGAVVTPCHTFTVPGTYDTVYNGTSNVNVNVTNASVNDCAGTVRCVEITCNLQSLFAATYASEAACDITLPGGQQVTARLSRLADTYTNITNSICRVALPAGTTIADMTGNWNFKFRDTYNDSAGLAESRVSNISVKVFSQAAPSAFRTITVPDGVDSVRTDPDTDTGAFGVTYVKINTGAVNGANGEYMRIDASASVGIPSPNRGNQSGYAGPWTVAIYNANGEVLFDSTSSLSVNFGASGPDKKDGSSGTMNSGPNTTGPLYVAFMPWDVGTEALYDDDANPSYSHYLPRAYPSFGMRGEAQFASYYDINVRVQRGTEATSPNWPDLSTVYTDRPLTTRMTIESPGEIRLVRFRLPGPIHRAAGDWLDIDTSYSSLSAVYPTATRNDVEIALYNAAGTMIAADDDDGADFTSALSFGRQAPVRPHLNLVSPGPDFNGRDGADLAAGEYYLAMTTFNADFTNNFTVTRLSTPSSATGYIYATINASVTPVTACGPADIGSQGGVAGYDGVLDNNDFVVFIDYFFTNNPAADVGKQGGIPGTDGQWNNNDFVVFINYFFAGCP